MSNLTNLIAASPATSRRSPSAPTSDSRRWPPPWSGWFAYRRALNAGAPAIPETGEPDRHALAVGGVVVAAVLIGFVVGPTFGTPEWAVAGAADLPSSPSPTTPSET